MWTSILPLGLWVQHLEWYLVLKEQIIHITCCYSYHLITVFRTHTMTHFYNKPCRNNSPPLKENENLQLVRLRCTHVATDRRAFPNSGTASVEGRGDRTYGLTGTGAPQSMPSREPRQLWVYIGYKHIKEAVNKCYANYQLTRKALTG